jgi:hypothetical protein
MLQGYLRSLSGNGESHRREEEETSSEAHHFGRWSVSQHPVPPKVAEEGKAFVRERKGDTLRDLLGGSWIQALRHKFAASSALGRPRNKARSTPVPKLRDS